MGPRKVTPRRKSASGGKVFAPGCARESVPEKPGRDPEEHKRPREESLPVPMKYIDVTGTTHTSLDVMLENQIDDY